jgi:methylenetetrahydrofolate reductase (NADPH)
MPASTLSPPEGTAGSLPPRRKALRPGRQGATIVSLPKGRCIPHSLSHPGQSTPEAPTVSILQSYPPGRLGLSFELFPPKSAESEAAMWRTVDDLVAWEPALITCTYGAGGSTRGKTLEILAGLRQRHGIAVASHLTCVGSTVDELRGYLREAEALGVTAIVALRGDPPKGETAFQAVDGGLSFASELVALIRAEFPRLGILVAGYPETHQEALSPQADLENLKRKVDNGGDVIVTQLFYDNADFLRFRDACRRLGIQAPVVPGVMPVTNFAQIRRIATLCGARLPDSFTRAFEAAGDDETAQFEAGVEFAAKQVEELVAAGVPGIHFYVLNKSPATIRVLEAVGIGGPKA